MASSHMSSWVVITRMNIALLRLAHVSYFPRTISISESLMLRVMLQYAFLWEAEGRPATVSKLSRALGCSRATTRRRLSTLMEYQYIRQIGRFYLCAEGLEDIQARRTLFDRYNQVITQTCKELAKLAGNPVVPD